VVAALTSNTAAGQELAELYARTAPPTDDELPHIASLVEKGGGRSWSQTQADNLLARALVRLGELGPETAAAAELTDLARLLTHRNH
jgi:geranylgeranyl diphosphate synthase type I